MPLAETPAQATNIISFNGSASSKASVLNYDVPLPGGTRGRRITEITGLNLNGVPWTDAATVSNSPLVGAAKNAAKGGARSILEFYLKLAQLAGVRAEILDNLRKLAGAIGKGSAGASKLPVTISLQDIDKLKSYAGPKLTAQDVENVNSYLAFQQHVIDGDFTNLMTPVANSKGDIQGYARAISAVGDGKRRFFFVETYCVSAFLGDYGLGRTVRTFTLFPGESVNISVKTWRSDTTSASSASSVFDSAESSASERFTNQVQSETTSTAQQSNSLDWHAEAKVDASWGWGNAEASGGAAGSNASSRTDFARGVSNAVGEHAQDASARRETTVSSSTEKTSTSGEEQNIERQIKNVNLRRTLNFVFRELNQKYTVKTHLTDVKIAYFGGSAGTWREVSVSRLRDLLTSVIDASAGTTFIDSIASEILTMQWVVFDKNDFPQRALEAIDVPAIPTSAITPVLVQPGANGKVSPPTASRYYRFPRGYIGQPDGTANQVLGIVVCEQEIVLRTDSVVVEALLGQADALDEYAMLSQKADAEAKELANERVRLINKGLEQISDGEKRVAAYADVLKTATPLKVEMS